MDTDFVSPPDADIIINDEPENISNVVEMFGKKKNRKGKKDRKDRRNKKDENDIIVHTKKDEKSSSPGILTLVMQNSLLLLPFGTFMLFNFLSDNFFSGKIIKSAETFYVVLTLAIAYYFSIKKMCNDENLSSSMTFSMVTILVINIFMLVNPCSKQLTFNQSNIIYGSMIFIIFNCINLFYIRNKSTQTCKRGKYDNVKVMLLMLIHAIVIYFSN
jgi:hypothetical protein